MIGISAMCDVRYSLNIGRRVPLAVAVTYRRERKYFQTSVKVSTLEEYEVAFSKSPKGIAMRKEVKSLFDMICGYADDLLRSNRFSLSALKEMVDSCGKQLREGGNTKAAGGLAIKKNGGAWGYWERFVASKEKVKTRESYAYAFGWFKRYTKRDISLGEIDQGWLNAYAKWLERQKCREAVKGGKRGENAESGRPLSLDARRNILGNLRAMLYQAKADGLIKDVPSFKGVVHTGNRRRLNALSVDEVLKLWNWWEPHPQKQSSGARAVGHWLLLYCLNGMNTVDMAKLRWGKEGNPRSKWPLLTFVSSKIDRVNNPVGKRLERTCVPIIPQLGRLIQEYGSDYKAGELVFPQICGGAESDEDRTKRIGDFNRKIGKNIKAACEELEIAPVTAQYARNSFISALAHHGVITAYIDYAVGHVTSDVSILLAGYINNVTPQMMHAFNSKIFEPIEQ